MIEHIIDRLGGVVRGTQLRPFGITRHRIARAVRTGSVQRLRSGVFAVPRACEDVVTAARHGGALTCARALQQHGVWTLSDDDEVHVWHGPTGRVHAHEPCGCVSHYHPGRMVLGIAPLPRALVHAFHCHGEELFFAAFESAWNKRLLSAADRRAVRAALPASARWLVDFAREDAESGLESLVRLRLHLIGISVQTQVEIDGVGRVDFVIAGRTILEADGKENHAGSRRHNDLLRDAAASRLGYETLRFDYAMIIYNWPIVEAAIRAALLRAAA
ncbi:type IV toxin-antitoxin system AbiEi family antitoxin domain-containing protein [Microbacterium sp. NPDC057659]|uniref:type IV toxin-antitoxin system AbiEi family antitoxin domain-containing protein n=1 Tax=Microbacterium sp. NPDC057659 TaxID=3346198 RepID=UPI003672F803